uniref:Uncharacterized protein n=1 Tax=Rhizophora mucronata TaxID=61149 RepID=A0A2P2PH81_RHIMU
MHIIFTHQGLLFSHTRAR